MKVSELINKSKAELKVYEAQLIQERFNLHMQKAVGQLSKFDLIKKNRRDLARVYTIMSQLRNEK